MARVCGLVFGLALIGGLTAISASAQGVGGAGGGDGARTPADPAAYHWALPEGISPPPVPPDNPMSEAKVELGRRLFGDVRLSFDRTTSCATCHDPARAFTDGRPRSIGASGEPTPRNAPTLWNVGWNVSYTWIDQGLTTLEQQIHLPLEGRAPVEMGFGEAALEALARDPVLSRAQSEAFPGEAMSADTVVRALAAYVRTLVKMDSPFDRYFRFDDDRDFGPAARAGLALFFSERLGCRRCHAGPSWSGPIAIPGRTVAPVFHRTAVSDATIPFRAPTLRFVAQTAPYMHDGSLATLPDVLDFYAKGGGRGAERLVPFTLSPDERAALIAFLEAL